MFRRWNPFKELDAIRKEVERVFDGYTPQGHRNLYSAFLPGVAARRYPLLNVTENSEEYTVEALAPGLDVETIDVNRQGQNNHRQWREKKHSRTWKPTSITAMSGQPVVSPPYPHLGY